MQIYPWVYQCSNGTPRDLGSFLSLISEGFGENYQFYHDNLGTNGHAGLDFPCAIGTPIYAPVAGKISYVSLAYATGGTGAGVEIETPEGQFLLWHFSRVDVKVGDSVSVGTQVGLSGNSGLSSGPHVHGEWRPKPLAYNNGFFGAVDFTSLISWQPLPNILDIMTEQEVRQLQVLEGYQDEAGVTYWTGKPLTAYLEARLRDKDAQIKKALSPIQSI